MISSLHIADYPAWSFTYASPQPAPVAVVAAGRVVACTPAARRAGIEVGVTPERARMLLPAVRIRQRDASLEQAVWEAVLQEVHASTPFLEPVPPTIFFRAEAEEAERLARGLRAQVGTAPHRFYALLAALSTSPGMTHEVRPERVESFLKSYPVARLVQLGFSEDAVSHLAFLGLRTLEAVRRLKLKHMRDQMREEGAKLYALLHPQEEPAIDLFQLPPAILKGHHFEDPVREPCELVPALERVVKEAAGALRGRACQRVRLALTPHRTAKAVFESRVLPTPSLSESRLLTTAKTLLHELLDRHLEVDALALELGALREPEYLQTGLFDAVTPQLLLALEGILQKYPGSLLRFTRNPEAVFHDEEQRAEPLTIDELRPKPARRRRGAG